MRDARVCKAEPRWVVREGARRGDYEVVTVFATAFSPFPDLSDEVLIQNSRAVSVQCEAGFGLHDGQQVPNMQIAVELGPSFIRQCSGFGEFGQLFHSLPVDFPRRGRIATRFDDHPENYLGFVPPGGLAIWPRLYR